MANVVNWIEIPSTDFDRAVKFYNAIYEQEMRILNMGGTDMAFIPMEGEGVGGAIIRTEHFKPGSDGAVVYLNGGDDLDIMLKRVEPAGGKVIMEKTIITDDYGCMAMFIDTEGNKIGLHSMK